MAENTKKRSMMAFKVPSMNWKRTVKDFCKDRGFVLSTFIYMAVEQRMNAIRAKEEARTEARIKAV